MSLKTINTVEEFNEIISNANISNENISTQNDSKKIVCVDFWAPWCGPCMNFLPIFEKVANQNNDVIFCKVNVDDLPEIASEYKVRSIPTILLFVNGTLKNQNIGSLNEADLINFINVV